MKTVTPPLAALLNAAGGLTPLVQVDLYAIYPTGGGVLLYTTAPFPITAPDNTYWNAPTLDGTGTLWTSGMTWLPKVIDTEQSKATGRWEVGANTGTWTVTMVPRPIDIVTGSPFPDQIGNQAFLQAARAGALDNADMIVSRAYFATMPVHPYPYAGVAPVGTVPIFRGFVSTVDCTLESVTIKATDYRALLDQNVPSRVYQASCRHRLYDSRCGLNPSGYSKTGTVLAGSTQAQIQATVAAPGGSGTFILGTLTMTSGANSGISRLVIGWDGTNFQLLAPFLNAIAAGDTFTVAAGCNKTLSACASFSNTANFGGEPLIPIPEVSLG